MLYMKLMPMRFIVLEYPSGTALVPNNLPVLNIIGGDTEQQPIMHAFHDLVSTNVYNNIVVKPFALFCFSSTQFNGIIFGVVCTYYYSSFVCVAFRVKKALADVYSTDILIIFYDTTDLRSSIRVPEDLGFSVRWNWMI